MNRFAMVAALCAVFLAASCGKMGPQVPSEADRGPLLAKVNGVDIYQAQVSAVLSRFGNIPPEKTKEAGRQVLDKIIEENVILQQAQDKKLDKDPKVIQALSAAHNEILVKAYLEQAASTAGKPTEAEIQAFFDGNPALFKERKVFTLRELSVPAKLDFLPKLQEAAAKAKSLEEVANWLRDQKIPFQVSAAPKAAEQLPVELLPRFSGMKNGEIVIVPAPGNISIIQLLGTEARPVDLATAKPAIERLLTSKKKNDAAGAEVKAQVQKAKIEYFGDYAQAQAKPAADGKK